VAIKVVNKSAFVEGAFGLNGDIGGIPKTTYYTPDGRIFRLPPNIREWVKRDKDGNVTGNGTRDANLDRGWTLTKPTVLKPYCKFCNNWHENTKEITACGVAQNRFIKQSERLAKREVKDNTSNLEKQVADLTALVNKLMEAQNGGLLQHGDTKPQRKDTGIRVSKEGI
jgi:hypothetical protein